MTYRAEFSRQNPAWIVFVVDHQSSSMARPFAVQPDTPIHFYKQPQINKGSGSPIAGSGRISISYRRDNVVLA